MIKSKLHRTTLGEIAEFRNGLNFDKKNFGDGIKVIGVSDFGNRFVPDYETLEEINPEGVVQEQDLLKINDIVFVRSNGNKELVGRSLFIDKDFKGAYSGFCIRMRLTSDSVEPRFVGYYTKSSLFKKFLNKGGRGTSINNLNQGILADVLLPNFERATQQKITKVLSDLDAKIELNNKINAELEAMAKLIYDYWFVQFDFPWDFTNNQPVTDATPSGAEVKPYKSSGGKMVWNEELKREIPEGWEVNFLTNEMDLQYGFPFSTTLFNNDNQGVPVVRIRDIQDCSISNYSTEEVDEKYRLLEGDLLIGMDGNFHLNYWDKEGAYLNQRCLRIRKRGNSISNIQTKYSIEPFIKAREQNVSRTTVAHLSARDINDLKVLKASLDIQEKADNLFDSLLKQIVNNRKQNQHLAALRDWLLPMLMNGQVKVGEKKQAPIVPLQKAQDFSAKEAKVRRKMLATYIINQSLEDQKFGKTKFEKLLHLVEYHVLKYDYKQTYSVQAAGPYDGKFTIPFWNEVTKAQWFALEESGMMKRVIAGSKHEKSLKDYGYLLEEEKEAINAFIRRFQNDDYKRPEIISTLYAVWNNRIIRKEMITDELLKQDFLAWDEGKAKYKDRLDGALNWMRTEGIVPDGWGKVIESKNR